MNPVSGVGGPIGSASVGPLANNVGLGGCACAGAGCMAVPMGGMGMGAMGPMFMGGMSPGFMMPGMAVAGMGMPVPVPSMPSMPGMGVMGMMGPMMMMSPPAPSAPSAFPKEANTIDQRVRRLCRDYGIDEANCLKLHDAMMNREDYDEDIQALHLVMERETGKGKKPVEALLTLIRALKTGRFAGKWLLDTDIWNFVTKYKVDDRVLHKLIQTLGGRKTTMKQDIKALDDRLSGAQELTGLGLLMRLLEGLAENGRLPSPPRRLGGSGTFHPTGTFLYPDRDRPRDRKRGRRKMERSSSRSRSRSRARSRSSR